MLRQDARARGREIALAQELQRAEEERHKLQSNVAREWGKSGAATRTCSISCAHAALGIALMVDVVRAHWRAGSIYRTHEDRLREGGRKGRTYRYHLWRRS
jgi:hypothetical protein